MWVVIFGFILMILGGRFDKSDYPGLSLLFVSFFQVYRNSIGDIKEPTYDLWYDSKDKFDSHGGFEYSGFWSGKSMMVIIWTFWFLNQFICMVMLLNFLIAIMAEQYEKITTYRNYYSLLRKCELN